MTSLITFQEYISIKQYGNLDKDYPKVSEFLDNACVFYDSNQEFFDWFKVREFEHKDPAYVLVPKFFWEFHKNIPDMIHVESDPLKNYFAGVQDHPVFQPADAFECPATPREEQVPLIEKITKEFQSTQRVNGIISAAPGFGKTFISIKLSALLNLKTLIIIPNEILSDQWIQAIINFTGLSKEDIGLIEGSEIKDIRNGLDKKITLIKVQSLYSQLKRIQPNNLKELYKNIGLVFYDECHTSGAAEGYAKTSSIFTTNNIIGLSATPYRIGLNDYLMQVSIGGILYRSEHKNLIPDCELYKLNIEFTDNEIKKLVSVSGDFVMFNSFFTMFLANKQPYFDYLADWVYYNQKQGHKTVVLFSTNKMVKKLHETFIKKYPDYDKETTLVLTGKTKKDVADLVSKERKRIMQEYKAFRETQDQRVKNKEIKRKEANLIIKEERKRIDSLIEDIKNNAYNLYNQKKDAADIIFSNYILLSAGFDKPELSNIIYGSPRIGKVSVIQSLGRITRIYEGKKQPLAQFMLPEVYLRFQKSAPVILINNIRIEYDTARIKKFYFD